MNRLKTKKAKRKWLVSLWLSYLMLCTLVLGGVTYSGYVTSASGSDSARVAKFHVEMTDNNDGQVSVKLDGSAAAGGIVEGTYPFTVSSDSEVTVGYEIIVEFTKSLPEGVTLTIADSTEKDITPTTDNDRKSFTFTSSDWQFAPNDTNAKEHTLNIIAALGTLNANFEDSVSVHVVATQKD